MISVCLAMLRDSDDTPRFEEFYNRFYKVAYYIAKDYFKNHETAEDCAQEVMMRFAKEFHNIKQDFNDSKLQNYVRIVSKCVAIDTFRKEKKHFDNVVDADLSEFFSLSTDSCEHDVCESMFLKDAVAAMPESYRYVFCLKYINELSGEQISKITGLSETYVRQKCLLGMRFVKNYKKESENG